MQRWQKELSSKITSPEELSKYIKLTKGDINRLKSVNGKFKMAITPYYLKLIDKNNPNCPIRKQAIPSIEELNIKKEELKDPLGDERRSPIKGITHRYPDRVLLYPTYNCAMYCRHCFRRRIVGQNDKALTDKELNLAINYIRNNKNIKEVILTGGDPLILSDDKIDKILTKIHNIKHVRWIRIHTRIFVTLPYRITPNLIKTLKKYRPLYIVTHVNHPKEITPQFRKAVDKTLKAGIIMLNQGVLLKGVNDNVNTIKELYYGLLGSGVKPYYLHQCDLAQGISHFRTSVQTGINILKNLRGFISGLGIPYYIIDTPGGFGKVPISHNYIKSYKNGSIDLETYRGYTKTYKE